MSLALTYFGACQVTRSGKEVAFATNAARALLAYLAVESDRPHPRDALTALLWPDQTQTAASTNFRQTLARLRKALSDSADTALCITSKTIQFNHTGVDSDVARFEALLAACDAHTHTGTGTHSSTSTHTGTSTHAELADCPDCIERLREAASLYRGEFLSGLFLEHSEPFEEWALLKREQLHRQVLSALITLTRHAEATGDFARMRQHAERQLTLEQWNEEAHRQLIRAMAYSGQRAAALTQFDTCRRVLQDELGIAPSNDTRALAERIRSGELSPTMIAAGLPRHNLPEQLTPFVGRERELAEIVAQLGQPDATGTLRPSTGSGSLRLLSHRDKRAGSSACGC